MGKGKLLIYISWHNTREVTRRIVAIGVNMRLKWILKNQRSNARIEFNWFRTGLSGRTFVKMMIMKLWVP
jgi:hypothetical protein